MLIIPRIPVGLVTRSVQWSGLNGVHEVRMAKDYSISVRPQVTYLMWDDLHYLCLVLLL